MSCSGSVDTTGAASLVEDKWNSVEQLAKNSVTDANAAMQAIIGATVSGVGVLGPAQTVFSVEPDPNITYATPDQPPLPNLDYADTPPNTLANFSEVAYVSPGAPPEFTATAPSSVPYSLQFNEPPQPGTFSDVYTPPAIAGFQSPVDPGPFTVNYTPGAIPSFNAISPPADFTETVPTPLPKPPIPTLSVQPIGDVPTVVSPEYPTAPTVVLPGDPQSISVPLPTLRTPDLSGIDALLESLLANQPTAPATTLPVDSFLDTFDSLRAKLGAELVPALAIEETLTWMLAGNTIGLPANVAQGLRDRAFGAEDRQAFQAEDQVMHEWLARGFTLPGGALDARLMEVRQTNRDKKSEINRDIWLEEAKMEIEQLRFAVEQGINYQGLLWDTKNKLWATCGELANRFLDVQIKVLESTLAVYRSQIEAWQAEATVTRDYINAKLQSELALLDITKSEVEIAGLYVNLNRQNVDLYQAKLGGVQTEVDIYKARVDAANSQMQGQTLKLEAFAQKVAAYAAAVNAYEAEWNGYSAAVNADNAQIEGFKALVQAYGTRVSAYGTQVDAESTRVSSEVETNKLALDEFRTQADVYNTKVSAYNTQVGAERTRLESEVALARLPLDAYATKVQVYAANVDAYGKRVSAEAEKVRAETEIFKLPTANFVAETQAYAARMDGYGKQVDAARAEIDAQVEVEKLKLEAFRAELETYQAELQRAGIEVDAKTKVHDSQVRLFDSKVRAEESRNDVLVKLEDLSLRQREIFANVTLKEIDLAQTKVLELIKIAQQGQSEVARVAAQLAGSALSAVSTSASISEGYSRSRDISCNESHSYSYNP